MTVIAWDGTTLAADKRSTNGGLSRTTTKIVRHEEKLLGVTGDWDIGVELRAWYVYGADPEKFPEIARKDDGKATLTVIDRAGIRVYNSGPYPLFVEDKYYAAGSGRDFALAAMYLGRSAVEAVRIACVFQSDCGNGCDELMLETPGTWKEVPHG